MSDQARGEGNGYQSSAHRADSPPSAHRADSPPRAHRADSPAGAHRADSPAGARLASPPRARGTVVGSLLRSMANTADRLFGPLSPPRVMSPPRTASPASPALGSLVRSLTRPEFREAFRRDPRSALHHAGLDERKLPQDQLKLLESLPETDLEILARVVGGLRRANHGRAVSL